MDLEKIESLVKMIENSSLTQFTLKEGELKITMSKLDHPPVVAPGAVPVAPVMMEQAADEGEGRWNCVQQNFNCQPG